MKSKSLANGWNVNCVKCATACNASVVSRKDVIDWSGDMPKFNIILGSG